MRVADKSDFGGQLTIALCGAILLASNVAPTQEIIIIATETTSERLLGLALLSMLMGTLILFYSHFTSTQRFSKTTGIKTLTLLGKRVGDSFTRHTGVVVHSDCNAEDSYPSLRYG